MVDQEKVSPNETTHIDELDRLLLEVAKSKKQTALAEAKLALANNENAELNYKYLVLQIYMKYGLSPTDGIKEEDGSIIRGQTAESTQGKS